MELCGADSAGISVERPDKTETDYFHWIATAGDYAGFLNALLPRHPSACGVCLKRRPAPALPRLAALLRPDGHQASTVTDGILLPGRVDERQGTVWIMAHGRKMALDGEDLKLMQVLPPCRPFVTQVRVFR